MTFKERIQGVPNRYLVAARNLIQKAHSDERIALGRQHLNANENDVLAFSRS
jgi:hypothetical protein